MNEDILKGKWNEIKGGFHTCRTGVLDRQFAGERGVNREIIRKGGEHER